MKDCFLKGWCLLTITYSIVAVHGLGSNPDWAWTHEETGAMWLKHFLPKACPRARIMAFNHNSAWDINAPVKSVDVCGQQLLDALNTSRAVRTRIEEISKATRKVGCRF